MNTTRILSLRIQLPAPSPELSHRLPGERMPDGGGRVRGLFEPHGTLTEPCEISNAAGSASSGSDVAGVQTAGHGGVLRSLHDGAAIRENRQLVRVERTLQQKFIGKHGSKPLEARLEGGEVEGPRFGLMNLHGVPPAHADM